jgi:hypothetical protein
MTEQRIMEEFELEEISGVDFPAQAHAKVTILKRYSDDEDEDEEKSYDYDDEEEKGYDYKAEDPPGTGRRGSDRNPEGSASGPRGGISISDSVETALKNKVSGHNEGSDRKVTLGMLKAVYRRGAGAYSTSARAQSRNQWAMARVNAFLHLVKTGSPKNSTYTTDNDLLPKGHPRAAKGEDAMKVLPAPKEGESRADFVSRFMADEEARKEFPDEAQRTAVANQQFRAERTEKRAFHLLSVVNGHSHLIHVDAEGGQSTHDFAPDDEMGHHHPWVLNEDGSITIGMADGHTHEVGMTQMSDSDSAGPDAGSKGRTEEETMTKQTDAVSEQAVDQQLDALQAELQLAKAYGQLTDAQKAFASDLAEGEERDAFITKSDDERQRLVEKAQEADPVAYTCIDGTEIRRSAGDLVIRLAKQADEATRELAVEKAARADEQLAKRAESELENLPGDDVAKVALLRAVDTIADEAVRGSVGEILKAANERGSAAFKSLGTAAKSASAVDAEAKLADLVSKRAEETGESNNKALFAVLSTAEGRSLYAQTR